MASSIMGRAIAKKVIYAKAYQLRDWTHDKHHTVDDAPYGGGPGMVLKVEPIFEAVESLKKKITKGKTKPKMRTILFSTRGKVFTQKEAKRLSRYDDIIFICGHYEGVDERVAKHIADEEISLGNFVLSGGELGALIVIDAVARLIPGVLGRHESLEEKKGSFPTFTRPPVFYPKKNKKTPAWKVPPVLLSGDHKKIEEWRQKA